MIEKIKQRYRTFRHNMNYKEHYAARVITILLILLILDLIGLYLVW